MARNRLLCAGMLCAAALVCGASAGAAEPGPWDRVLANDFQVAAPEGAGLADLEAAYYAARARADVPAAYATAVRLLRARATRAEALTDLRRVRELAPACARTDDLRALLAELQERSDLHPALGAAVEDLRLDLALAARDAQALAKLDAAGAWVRTWARVVGPFAGPKPFQIDRAEVFEQDPDRDAYTDGFGREVRVRTDLRATRAGRVDLGAHLPHRHEASAYLVALLHAETEQDVLLGLHLSGAARVWLGGAPVHRTVPYPTYRRPRALVSVRLRAGVNALLVKVHSQARVGVEVLGPEGGPTPSVRAVGWQERGGARIRPRRMYGILSGREAREPGAPPEDAPLDEGTPVHARLRALEALEHAGRVQAVRRGWQALADAHPRSALVLVEAAMARLRESDHEIDAPERLHKEAAALLRRAIAVRAEDPRAHLLLGMYLDGRDEREQALKHLRAAAQAAPDWPRARLRLAEALADRGWLGLAEQELKAAQGNHDRARTALADVLAREGRLAEAARLRTAAWEAGELDPRRYEALVRDRADWQAHAQLAAEYTRLRPRDPAARRDALRWRVQAARDRGELETAARLLETLAHERPTDARPCVERAELALRAEDRDAALAWFDRALARRRGAGRTDFDLEQRVRALRENTWPQFAYDLGLKEVVPDDYTAERFPTAHHAVLLRVVVRRLGPGGGAESLVHHAVKVFDKQGIARLGELQLPDRADDILYCRTILPDGRVFTPTNLRRLDFTNASMVRVVPGAVLEYAFRETRSGGRSTTFADEVRFQEFHAPVARARYVLLVPRELLGDVEVEAWPRDFAPTHTDAAQPSLYAVGRPAAFIWDASEVAPLRPEPNSPPEVEVLRNLQVRVRAPDWGPGAHLFRAPAPLRVDEAVKGLARTATEGLAADRDKALALHAAVRERLRPVGGARTARDALALESGGPEVAQRLFLALCREAGVRAHPALINRTLPRPAWRARERSEVVDAFGAPAVCVRPAQGPALWMRFHEPARLFRPGDLGEGAAGAPALVEEDGLRVFRRVRGAQTEDQPAQADVTVHVNPDGSARVTGEVTFYGVLAGRLRRATLDPQQGPRSMERIALSVFPRLVIETSDYPAPDPDAPADPAVDSEPFVYRFAGTVARFARSEGGRLVFSPFSGSLHAVEGLLAEPERETPFVVRHDVEVHEAIRYRIPEGWAVAEAPRSVHWRGAFGFYLMNFRVQGRELRAARTLFIPARSIPAWMYPTLARFLEACGRTDDETVALAPREALGLRPGAAREVAEIRSARLVDQRAWRPRWWPEGPDDAPGDEPREP